MIFQSNRIALSLLMCCLLVTTEVYAQGRYEGKLIVEPLSDGRNLRVLRPITYIDPNGIRWAVPAGIVTDGASVPRVAWSLFPPFAGKHRLAAVIHDRYCQIRDRPWEKVHRMFYEAMIAAKVDLISAKTMYGAVWAFGPRWLPGGGKMRGGNTFLSRKEKQKKLEELQRWIKTDNPSPDKIEEMSSKS